MPESRASNLSASGAGCRNESASKYFRSWWPEQDFMSIFCRLPTLDEEIGDTGVGEMIEPLETLRGKYPCAATLVAF